MFKWIREAIRERRAGKLVDVEIKKLAQRLDDLTENINRRNLESGEGTLIDRVRAAAEATKPIREYRNLVTQARLFERLERAGIEIPEQFLSPFDPALPINPTVVLGRKLLTDAGKHWARVELRRYNEERIEFWAKLILPILSLVVSIIALAVATHKH
jgi:lipopolysaccharide export LptBFGC system permease protein LptF